jgi:orotidine-5'-phosphate decarboxylase
MPEMFADRLAKAVKKKNSRAVAGIDPRPDLLPSKVASRYKAGSEGKAMLAFAKGLIDAVEPYVCAVKPQNAFFEALGVNGVKAYKEAVQYARKNGLLVIGDVKRGDIGTTAAAYAEAHLTPGADFEVDAVTVNAYLGHDGIAPFLDSCAAHGKGLFVLLRTSNPSAKQLQDIGDEGSTVWERLAALVSEWGKGLIGKCGYSSVGAVAGATYPEEAARLRELAPEMVLLMPGYGAQGGKAADVARCLDENGLGAVVASSRGIMYAFRDKDGKETDPWTKAVAAAAEAMRDDINSHLAG